MINVLQCNFTGPPLLARPGQLLILPQYTRGKEGASRRTSKLANMYKPNTNLTTNDICPPNHTIRSTVFPNKKCFGLLSLGRWLKQELAHNSFVSSLVLFKLKHKRSSGSNTMQVTPLTKSIQVKEVKECPARLF